jgi:hypothetical protein
MIKALGIGPEGRFKRASVGSPLDLFAFVYLEEGLNHWPSFEAFYYGAPPISGRVDSLRDLERVSA